MESSAETSPLLGPSSLPYTLGDLSAGYLSNRSDRNAEFPREAVDRADVLSATSDAGSFKCESVTVCPGIPIAAVASSADWRIWVGIAMCYIAAAVALWALFNSLKFDQQITIDPLLHKNLQLDLRNCNFYVENAPPGTLGALRVTTWLMALKHGFLLRSVSSSIIQSTTSTLSVRLLAAYASQYFQCSVRLFVAPNTTFDTIRISYEPDNAYVEVVAAAPLRAKKSISASLFHGSVRLNDLVTPKVTVSIGDGSVNLGFPSKFASMDGAPIAEIETTSAPVFVESCHPIRIEVPLNNAENAFFRADGSVSVYNAQGPANEQLTIAELEPEEQCGAETITVKLNPLDAPIYGIVHSEGAVVEAIDFLTWAGRRHENPTFTTASLSRIRKLKKWIDQERHGNWIASVHLSGWFIPSGYWRFVSSAAFIECNDIFMLTSAGLLTPDQTSLQLHIMGLHCSWDDVHGSATRDTSALLLQKDDMGLLSHTPVHTEVKGRRLFGDEPPGRYVNNTYVGTRCPAQVMQKQFRAFWSAFTTIHQSSIYPLWRASDSDIFRKSEQAEHKRTQQYFFDIHRDAVVIEPIKWTRFRLFFDATVAVNLVASALGAYWISRWTFSALESELLDPLDNDDALDRDASYRLDNDFAGPSENWHLGITRSETLTQRFFRVRWSPRALRFSRLGVQIQQVDVCEDAQVNELLSDQSPQARQLQRAGPILAEQITWSKSRDHRMEVNTIFVLDPKHAVKHVTTLSGTQHQLLIPYRHPFPGPNPFHPEVIQQRWTIRHDKRYRFKLLAMNRSGQVLQESDWSPESCLGSTFGMLRIPTLVTRRLKQSTPNSLSMFLLKYALLSPPTIWNLSFEGIQLHVLQKSTHISALDERDKLLGMQPGSNQRMDDLSDELDVAVFVGSDTLKARRVADIARVPAWLQTTLTLNPSAEPLEKGASVYVACQKAKKMILSLWMMRGIEKNFSVEVTAPIGGRTLGQGSVPVDGIQLAATHHLASYYRSDRVSFDDDTDPILSIKVSLNSAITGEPWGKLELRLDCSPLKPYIRHEFPTIDPDVNPESSGRHHVATTQPCFIRDVAGAYFCRGSDAVIRWYWPPGAAKPDNVYLHLVDDATNQWLMAIHEGKPIQNTGAFSWPIDAPFDDKTICRLTRMILTDRPRTSTHPVEVLAQSHAFFITRSLTLAEMELNYAAFCRSAQMPMLQLSEQSLAAHGIMVVNQMTRVCEGVRSKLPFERSCGLMATRGQCLVSTSARMTMTRPDGFNPIVEDGLTSAVHVIKAQNVLIPIVENVYLDPDPHFWKNSPDFYAMMMRRYITIPGLRRNKHLSQMWMWMSGVEGVPGTESQSGVFLRPGPHEEFRSRRFNLFVLFPLVIQCISTLVKICAGYAPDVAIIGLIVFSNYLSVTYDETVRSGHVDSRFLMDAAFAPNFIQFCSGIPLGYLVCLLLVILQSATTMVLDGWSDRTTHFQSNSVVYGIERFSIFTRWTRLFLFLSFSVSVALWFLATALCWSDAYFSTLVVIGAIGFVVYSVSASFASAQERVVAYVNTNLQRLLGLALDGWFDATNTDFHDLTGEAVDREMNVDTGERIRDAFKVWKWRAKRFKGLDRISFFTSGHEAEQHTRLSNHMFQSLGFDGTHRELMSSAASPVETNLFDSTSPAMPYARSRQSAYFHNKVASWRLSLWSTPKGKPFLVNSAGQLSKGDLEHMAIAARLACQEDLEGEFKDEVSTLTPAGSIDEPIAFQGGYLQVVGGHEPQLVIGLKPGQVFYKAVILTPSFFRAKAVPYATKLGMIFNYFDDKQKGRWREREYRAWLTALQKPGVRRSWINLQHRAWLDSRMRIHPVLGLTIMELNQYYKRYKIIDLDYTALFPTSEEASSSTNSSSDSSHRGLNDADSHGESNPSLSTTEDESEDSDEGSLDSDRDAWINSKKRSDSESDQGESSSEATDDEQAKIRRRLKSDLNARKLHVIYSHATQSHRDNRVDELVGQINTFTMKVLESEYRILTPTFGSSILFGGKKNRTEVVPHRPVDTNLVSVSRMNSMPTSEEKSSAASSLPEDPMEGSPLSARSKDEAKKHNVRFQLETTKRESDVLKEEIVPSTSSGSKNLLSSHGDDPNVTQEWASRIIAVAVFQTQALGAAFAETTRQMFDPIRMNRLVTEFFDDISVERIQKTATWILSPVSPVQLKQLHPDTHSQIKGKLLTTHQLLERLASFRVTGIMRAACVIELARLPENAHWAIRTYLIVEVLCSLGCLKEEEVCTRRTLSLRALDDTTLEFQAYIPTVAELASFIDSIIDKHYASLDDFRADDVFAVVKIILTEYLCLSSFILLLLVQGFRIRSDLFPSAYSSNRAGTIEERNQTAIAQVFNDLSGHTGFLHRSLADEAVLLLTENKVNFVGTVVALHFLWIDYTDHFGGARTCEDACRLLGLSESSPVLAIERSHNDWDPEVDFTWYWGAAQRSPGLLEVFHGIVENTVLGFISKSQLIQLANEIRSTELHPRVADMQPQVRFNASHRVPERVDVCTLETFHQTLTKLQLCISREHTDFLWILMCTDVCDGQIAEKLPTVVCVDCLTALMLQPRLADGRKLNWDQGTTEAKYYTGWLDIQIFTALLRELEITIKPKYIRKIWSGFKKEPLNIKDYLPAGLHMNEAWLRLGQGRLGLDPYQGIFVKSSTVFRELPKILFTGLWPEGLRALVAFALQLEPSTEQLEQATRTAAGRRNRFGLIRHSDVAKILTSLSVEGMSFSILEESISKMRLKVPKGMIRQMFAIMDINQDKTLDLSELLTGFEVLFSNFIPPLVIQAVGVGTDDKMRAIFRAIGVLLALFLFIGLAYAAFASGGTDANSNAMQSLLAVVGAYTLQNSARQDEKDVAVGMRKRIELILGEGLDKRLQEQEAMDQIISAHTHKQDLIQQQKLLTENMSTGVITYHIPSKFLKGTTETSTPSVQVRVGVDMSLVPTIAGLSDRSRLVWRCRPPFSRRSGLHFDPLTGIISGRYMGEEYLNAFKGKSLPSTKSKQRIVTVICKSDGRIVGRTRLAYELVDELLPSSPKPSSLHLPAVPQLELKPLVD